MATETHEANEPLDSTAAVSQPTDGSHRRACHRTTSRMRCHALAPLPLHAPARHTRLLLHAERHMAMEEDGSTERVRERRSKTPLD